MKKKILFILSLLSVMPIHAMATDASPAALSVAVYDFKGDGDTAQIGRNVTTLITANLTAETNLVLVERTQLSKALNEQAFGVSGLVSADAAAQIGQITGAKVLVAGQVIQTGDNHLVIVADIIGTETGRLFADKVEGPADNLMDLTSQLSRKIAQTISDQATNLATLEGESHDEYLERIINSVKGTNRPSVSVNIIYPRGKNRHSSTAEGEFGILLLKTGFPVVDANSDRKPDVEITGVDDCDAAPRQGQLYSFRTVIELKVQERRTGDILVFDRQESSATDADRAGAGRTSQVNAVDALAERVLPLIAK